MSNAMYSLFRVSLILVITLLVVAPANAATIVLNSTADNLTGGNSLCTLREAIMNANANADTTAGDCVSGLGADVISIPAGTYAITIAGAGEDSNATGDFDSTDAAGITIQGAGAATTIIDGASLDRVFNSTSGTFTIDSVTVQNGNITGISGGGLFALTVIVSNSTFSGNTTSEDGGGVFASAVTITNSTFSGNSSTFGGALSIAGLATIANSTFSGNSASVGGAMANINSVITNSTIFGNTAILTGGVHFDSSATFTNTILSTNSGGNCGGFGALTSGGNNIDSANNCGFGGAGDQINTNPLLGPLANNGGTTLTHLLLAGSPAIGMGNPAVCAAAPVSNIDQRGVSRPQGAVCDIGAYEADYFLLTTSVTGTGSINSAPGAINCPGVCSESFLENSAISLTNTPGVGFLFTGWSGSCTGTGACNVTMSTARNVTATFALPSFTVTGTAGPGGTIGVTPQTISQGLTAIFAVTPSAGFAIDTVTGCGGSLVANTYTTAAITADCVVNAIFRALPSPPPAVPRHRLEVTVVGDGGVISGPSGINCPDGLCIASFVSGNYVTLFPSPGLTKWGGACAGQPASGPCTVFIAGGAVFVTAIFENEGLGCVNPDIDLVWPEEETDLSGNFSIFLWKSLSSPSNGNHTYELNISTRSDLDRSQKTITIDVMETVVALGSMGSGVILLGMVFGGAVRRKGKITILALALLTGGVMVGCGTNGSDSNNGSDGGNNGGGGAPYSACDEVPKGMGYVCKEVGELDLETEYYWWVISEDKTSCPRRFTTGAQP